MNHTAYLITGASGFLGRHLLQQLAAATPKGKATTVYALVRDPDDWQSQVWVAPLRQQLDLQVLAGGLSDVARWQPKLEAQLRAHSSGTGTRTGTGKAMLLQGIFHLAAKVEHSRQNPNPVYRTNVDGACAMVRLAHDLAAGTTAKPRVLFVSTSGTVGCFDNPKQTADESAPFCNGKVRTWPYYDSKIQAEQQTRALANKLGVQLSILRPPVLLGPGDHKLRATKQVLRFLNRRQPFTMQGGIHFVDIRDTAAAIVAAMQHPYPKPVYHLPGTACDISTFFDMLESITGVPAPRRKLSYPVAHSLARADGWLGRHLPGAGGQPLHIMPDPVVVEMAARYWGLSSLYAKEDLGFAPRDPNTTLWDTVAWLREHATA